MPMKRAGLILSFLLISLIALPQRADSLLQKARLFYQNDEYKMAIPLFRQLTEKDPGNYVLFGDLGKCYIQTGQIDKGITSYKKALEIRPDFSGAVYGLGNAYDISDNTDSAIYWFRKYTSLKPEDASGFIRLAVIFMDLSGEQDSSVFFAQKALILEPSNQSAYYTLAMAYIQTEKYNRAIDAAVKGLSYDSTSSLLYYPWGLSLFFQHNYGLAYQVFTRGAKYETRGSNLSNYRALSEIMKNTPVDSYIFDASGQPKFRDLNVRNMANLDKRSSDPADRYDYPKLVKKFDQDCFSMGLDEYFMLYYGYAGSPGYSPYSLRTDSLEQYLAAGQYDQYIRHAATLLAVDPTEFPVYNTLSMVYNMTGNDSKRYEDLVKYTGFKNAIMASGNGKDADHAFIVNNVNHEYEILRNLGLQPSMQKMTEIHGHYFDVLTGVASDGTKQQVWFNIDKPYGALSKLMREKQSRKGRRRLR